MDINRFTLLYERGVFLKWRASSFHSCWLPQKVESQVFIANGQTSCIVSDAGKKINLAFLALRGFVRIQCLAVSGT